MGLGKSDNTQFFYAGGRAGRVLTSDHLSGIFRGNFEWAVDVMPIYVVFPPAKRGLWRQHQAGDLEMEFYQREKDCSVLRRGGRRRFQQRQYSAGRYFPDQFHAWGCVWSARFCETEASVAF